MQWLATILQHHIKRHILWLATIHKLYINCSCLPQSCTASELITQDVKLLPFSDIGTLEEKLKRRTEQVHYYRAKLRGKEAKADALKEECECRIRTIRHCWRDMIYYEGSTPGKILKVSIIDSLALQL